MLWVCIVLQVLSVLAGASSGQHPASRRYPGWTRRNGGALRSSDGTFEGDRDSDRGGPVYFRLEQLYSEPKDKDCVKCMVPLVGSSKDPDLCSCLPCTFKIIPGHANIPRVIADNLHKLKCNFPCDDDDGRRSDTAKYLDLIEMLMRSDGGEVDKPVAEAKIVKEEFKPLGSGRRTNGKSPKHASDCPDGICEDMGPPRFRQSHSRKANKAFVETVPKGDAAGKRSGADTRYEPFVMDEKSRAGLGTYNMPYPKPSFHLPATRTTAPYKGREEEIKFRLQTRRSESKSGEKKSSDNRSRKEISGEALKTSKAETLREEGEEEKEEKPENRNIALAIATGPEATVVVPAWQSTSTDSEEYVNTAAKQPTNIPAESMIKNAETFPDDESEEAVEIREFDARESPMTQKHYPIQEEESTTVEAYPTTTENISSEEMEPFTDNTTVQSTEGSGGDSSEEYWQPEDNHHRSDKEETPSETTEDDVVVGFRRDDGTTTAEPEKKSKAGKERFRPKIVIEIADAKNSSKPGMDGVINMKVDIYSRGDLGNVYKFLSKLIPPKFRSEEANDKVGDSVQLRFRPLLDTYSDEIA